MDAFDFFKMFENKISEYTKAPYVVLVDSCTSGIFLCLKLFKPTTVICPSHTYFSVPQHIIHSGHKLEFKDFEWSKGYKLDPFPIYDYATWFEKDMYISGQYQCLSFQYKKPLHVNKGGAILLDNKEQYDLLKQLAFDGRDWYTKVADMKDISVLGYHMMMTPETACEGLLQFDRKKKSEIKTDKDYADVSKFSCFKC